MRTSTGIFMVAAFAVTFATPLEVKTGATTRDEANEAQTILGCLRRPMDRAIEWSRNSTRTFLLFSRREKSDRASDLMNVIYDGLQRDIDDSATIIIVDRSTCEKSNETADVRRNCDLLAKFTYVQKTSHILTDFMAESVPILVEAEVGAKHPSRDVWSQVISFAREQNRMLLRTVHRVVSCIESK